MNIFFLDRDPKLAAQYHCDKHVIKMILESAQLLSTAHHVLDGDKAPRGIYKSTHVNHPCSIWARQSKANYLWLWELTKELNAEFVKRYAKDEDHKTIRTLSSILCNPPNNISDVGFTDPPQCMPDEYKDSDTVEAYRNYYFGAKKDIVRWDYSETPYWY